MDQLRSVVITKPGFDTVRIGPFHYEHQARSFAHSLEFRAFQAARPEGTTVEVAAYDPELPHTPLPPNDVTLLVLVMDEETERGEAAYPDLYDRLVAHHGYERAADLWRHACLLLDADTAPTA